MQESDFPTYTTDCSPTDSRYSLSYTIPAYSSGSPVCCSNTGISSDPVLSRSPKDNILISLKLLLPVDAIFRPRNSFKLAILNVRSLMRIGQKGCLARALETLVINVSCSRNSYWRRKLCYPWSFIRVILGALRLRHLMLLTWIWLSVRGQKLHYLAGF